MRRAVLWRGARAVPRQSRATVCEIGQMDQHPVIRATRRWVSSMVIGLNLCPFARRVFAADKIRYVVSDAQDEGGLLNDLAGEVRALASSPASAVETTL